jgi:PAS domain S-box-containing protein
MEQQGWSSEQTPPPQIEEGVGYHPFVAASAEPTLIVDRETLEIVEANDAAVVVYGYSRREFLSLRLPDVVAGDQIASAIKGLDRESTYSAEFQHRAKFGRLITAQTSATPLPLGDRDACLITLEVSRAFELLQERTEVLQRIFDHSPAMIALVDDGDRILAVNREWERVLGTSQAEAREWEDIWIADPAERDSGMDFVHAADGTRREFRLKVPGGLVDTIWTNVRLSDGSILAFGQDITERKKAEQELVAAREQLETTAEGKIASGNTYGLTFRELTVLHLVAAGNTDAEVARILGISLRTAESHVAGVLHKMHASTRTEAGVRAVREGLID